MESRRRAHQPTSGAREGMRHRASRPVDVRGLRLPAARPGAQDLEVDLTVEAGEVVAVTGLGDAGSTLLRTLAGATPVDAERAVVAGVPLSARGRRADRAVLHVPASARRRLRRLARRGDVAGAALLLLDEPFEVLDDETDVARLTGLLAGLAASGAAAAVVHVGDPSPHAELWDRVIDLRAAHGHSQDEAVIDLRDRPVQPTALDPAAPPA